MKKIISIFSLILPISIFAIDIGVLDSGINWNSSTLTITEFKDTDTGATEFNCFGASLAKKTVPLKNIFSNSVAGSTDGTESSETACKTAGDYTFEIKLVDMAGNTFEKTGYKLRVFPSDADHMNLEYSNCNTDSTGVIADGNKACEISVEVFDKYYNKFAKFNNGSGVRSENSSINLEIKDQGNTSYFDYYTMNTDDLFRDGLMPPPEVNSLDSDAKTTMELKANAPSIDIIQGADSDAKVSFLTAKEVDLLFEFYKVNDNGTLNANKNTLTESGTFKFSPWVKLALEDPDNKLGSLEIDGTGAEIKIKSMTGVAGVNLPSGLKTKLIDISSSGIDIDLADDVNFNSFANLENGLSLTGWGIDSIDETMSRFLRLIKGNGVLSSLDWGIVTKITHETKSNKNISYPGGNLGETAFWKNKTPDVNYNTDDCLNCDTSDLSGNIAFIGADIEGQVRSKKDIFGLGMGVGDGHIINMGGLSVKDTREEITRNAYSLYRSLSPDTAENISIDGIDFTNKDEYPTGVAYYKGNTVSLKGEITGIGTIVIVDGNLVIEDNMNYTNQATDSLGVILVNTKIEKPEDGKVLETGNIFVKSDVQKMVGTYFADGSLLSLSSTATVGTPVLSYIYPGEDNLNSQLLLKGTIFSYNTLGGSEILDIDTGKYSTPWGEVEEQDEAKIFDIHHIRRYDKNTGTCVKNTNNNADCDTNHFAFIIRPDGKIKNITPPGFVVKNIINR